MSRELWKNCYELCGCRKVVSHFWLKQLWNLSLSISPLKQLWNISLFSSIWKKLKTKSGSKVLKKLYFVKAVASGKKQFQVPHVWLTFCFSKTEAFSRRRAKHPFLQVFFFVLVSKWPTQAVTVPLEKTYLNITN